MKLVMSNKEYSKMATILAAISNEEIPKTLSNTNNEGLCSIVVENDIITIDVATDYVVAVYGEIGIWIEPIVTAVKSLISLAKLAYHSIAKTEEEVAFILKERYMRQKESEKPSAKKIDLAKARKKTVDDTKAPF